MLEKGTQFPSLKQLLSFSQNKGNPPLRGFICLKPVSSDTFCCFWERVSRDTEFWPFLVCFFTVLHSLTPAFLKTSSNRKSLWYRCKCNSFILPGEVISKVQSKPQH